MIRAGIPLLLLTAGGCTGAPGSFCSGDVECRAGLRCVSANSGRGICTYPPSTASDASGPEARPGDRALETLPDQRRRLEALPVEARPVEARPEGSSKDRSGEPSTVD